MNDINGIEIKDGDIVQYTIISTILQTKYKDVYQFPATIFNGELCLKNNQGVCIPIYFFEKYNLKIISK